MKYNNWINIADLMSVLMMIFLFISISYLYQVGERTKELNKQVNEGKILKEKIDKLSVSRELIHSKINKSLNSLLGNKLKKWNAYITEDNSIIFESSDSLFKAGSAELSKSFATAINEFFPIFIKSIDKDYLTSIEHIDIDGHSSSEWSKGSSEKDKYLHNLNLSQTRAYNVLRQCILSLSIREYRWVLKKLRSRGASSSRPVYSKSDIENKKLSRRVEFKITLKDKETLENILNMIK